MDMVRVENLVKRYRPDGPLALDGIDLSVPRGALFGLLGPNGAGKSTLLSILLGLVRPGSGSVSIAGLDVREQTAAVRRLTGLVPQELAFYPMLSVEENLSLFAALATPDRAARKRRREFCIEAAGLQEFLHQPAGACSGGQQRRLNLAIGLLGEPELLCLDEPTVGIDPQSRHYILEVIRELNRGGMTVIYTSHYLSEVQQLCTELAVLDHGRVILEGPTEKLLAVKHADVVEFELDRNLEREQCASIPGFLDLEENRLRIAQENPDQAMRSLLALLDREQVRVVAIRQQAVTLEQLYLQLTHTELRE